MKNKILLIAAGLVLCVVNASSQTKTKKINYEKNPVWIQMMNDTTANFYETVEAFREYFKDRAMPEEPFESEGGDTFEKEIGLEEEREGGEKSKREIEREQRKPNPKEPSYAAEVRAFKGWYQDSKLWLREDGSIIGPLERQAIVDRQQQELKAIEKANGKK
ncbi:MAG: hypothetical protein IPP69_09390 [Flavobacteriales bacterium]|nr:hypothetical protein [Flavobacteriales bacterium]